MGFIASIISAVVDVIVDIVEAVIQVIEIVIQIIMVLLGFNGGSTQVVEYFEVRNYPLFDEIDKKNPLLSSVLHSIISGKDITSNLIYHSTFRSLKGSVKEFTKFIELGNYFEGFPALDSYILIINYTELTAALQTLTGVPCTAEASGVRALSQSDWIKYWLQENKVYDVGANTIGTGNASVTTSPSTPAATSHTQHTNFSITITDQIGTSDSVVVNSLSAIVTSPSSTSSSYALVNNLIVGVTDGVATHDSVIIDQRWHVNFNTVVYNATPDTYTVQVYNDSGTILTLPYTVPSRPGQLHYVSNYFRNSLPSRQYLFVYKVGAGTYPDLDTIEEPINMDNSVLQAFPAVPLRISNANYTTFGTSKKTKIEQLLDTVDLDAEKIIDAVMNDPGAAPGDIDHVYVTFGVRMWDTSQAGMSYLFTMFENLYPAQGSTQGAYNNTGSGDTKPTNNILTTTADNHAAFQFNYITYTFTPLSTINANSGSTENGIYYSDMSRFGSDGLLKYQYYSSSGKGTYNVGYKADTLTEVANFLAGSGTTNPGTTTSEAANWLQVTERMSYNNPSPTLLESDGSAASLKYLTPDLVYENNGSGVLKLVQKASEPTTSGQSITYYCIKYNGLDAYTVAAPIAALRVIDGDTGKFKTVKFNLGNRGDLMVPFIHTFIKDLSQTQVAKLFLAGAHVSIYIAHYEVIVHAGMSFLTALVLLVVIILVVVYVASTGDASGGVTLLEALTAAAAIGGTAVLLVLVTAFVNLLITLAIQLIVQKIVTEIAGDGELGQILGLLAGLAVGSMDIGISYGSAPGTAPLGSYGHTGGSTLGAGGGSLNVPGTINPQGVYITTNFSAVKLPSLSSPTELLQAGERILNTIGKFLNVRVKSAEEELDLEIGAYAKLAGERRKELKEIDDFINAHMAGITPVDLRNTQQKMFQTANVTAHGYYLMWGQKSTIENGRYDYTFQNTVEPYNAFT